MTTRHRVVVGVMVLAGAVAAMRAATVEPSTPASPAEQPGPSASADSRLPTPDSRLPTPDSRRRTAWLQTQLVTAPAGTLITVPAGVYHGPFLVARSLHLRGEDAVWRETPLPQGFASGRLALRGDVVAALDLARGVCWLRVETSSPWSRVDAAGCVDVALLGADDGRATLLLACAEAGGSLALLRAHCDGRVEAPQRVATIRRAEEVEDPTVSLRAVGREGVLCVALVDGLAYVVSASRS